MKKVTILDVAAKAGVSPMTVSRVVNNGPSVRPETRARVLAAVESLNFRPNQWARSLRVRRSHWILLVFSRSKRGSRGIVSSYIVDLQAGIMHRCQQDGYHIFLQACDANDVRQQAELVERAADTRPDGVLLIPPLCFSTDLVAGFRRLGIPLVRVSPVDFSDPSPAVVVDDFAAARQMAEYLIGLGHRRIGFIKGHPEHAASAQRFEGYCAALRAAGIEYRGQDVAQGRFTIDSGVEAARKLLLRSSRPTAVFASNDDMAAGCLTVAHEAGIRVPEQLSIAGFDDTYLATMVWPPLTTVRQPIFDLGFAATHQLFSLIQHGKAANKVTLSYRLIERESTAAPVVRPRR